MDDDRRMTCERLLEALDDYLDGRGDAAMRAGIDAHLATCATCPALVSDVRTISRTARTLEPMEPPARVWRHVQTRLRLETPPRTSRLERLGSSVSKWRMLPPLAAAAGLVLVVSSLTWVGARLTRTAPVATVATAGGAPVEFELAEAEYSDAIARLQEAADAAGPRLDALTNASLQSSIDDIDGAIGDAREALSREPGDELSQESLLDALGSKVALLQDTVALIGDADERSEERNP